MKRFDSYYQINANINEKNPLKELDYVSNVNVKSLITQEPTRDIMEDIVVLKRVADYMNSSFTSVYNQTQTAIDYYTSEEGLEDFQEFMRNFTPHYYDGEYLERIIEDWYYNEELKYIELGPEGYEALYNPPEEIPEELPYTFESLLWDFYVLWFEIWIACGLYLLARPDLIDMEEAFIEGIEKIKDFFVGKPKTTDEIIFEELAWYCSEMSRLSQGQEPTEQIIVLKHPSNLEVMFDVVKTFAKKYYNQIFDYISNT